MDWGQTFISGMQSENQNRIMKALQSLEGLKYFGGTPSEGLATNLKQALGVELPMSPSSDDPSTYGYDFIPGQSLMNLAKIKNEGTLTTDRLRAALMAKQIQGTISEEEGKVLNSLNTTKAPFYSTQLPPDKMGQWAGVQGGLIPDANNTNSINSRTKMFYDNLKFRQEALNRLEKYRKETQMDDEKYRAARLEIDRTSKATTGELLQAILSGEDAPAFDYENLYNINLSGQGGYGGGGSDLGLMGIAAQAKGIEDPEQRKAFLKEQMGNIAGQLMKMIDGE